MFHQICLKCVYSNLMLLYGKKQHKYSAEHSVCFTEERKPYRLGMTKRWDIILFFWVNYVFNFLIFVLYELKEREVRINFWHICKDLQKERERGHKTAWQISSCACSDWQRSDSSSWVPGHCWRTGSKSQMSYGEKKISLIYAWRQTHHTSSVSSVFWNDHSASSHILTPLRSCCSIQVTCWRCLKHIFLRQPLHCSHHAPLITLCLRRHAALNRVTGLLPQRRSAEQSTLASRGTEASHVTPNEEIQT